MAWPSVADLEVTEKRLAFRYVIMTQINCLRFELPGMFPAHPENDTIEPFRFSNEELLPRQQNLIGKVEGFNFNPLFHAKHFFLEIEIIKVILGLYIRRTAVVAEWYVTSPLYKRQQ